VNRPDDVSRAKASGVPGLALSPTTPPPDAKTPVRHPEAPPPGTELGVHYPYCFACGDRQPNGLHLRVMAAEGVAVTAEFEVGTAHQGAPGLIHGGLLSLAFDEALGSVNWMLRTPAVTGRLETDYLKPVPVARTVYISAWCEGAHGRKLYHRAEGRLDGPDGELVARAGALFIQVGLEHFTTHGRAEEVRAVLDDPGQYPLRAFEVNP
jgi:acyl-coenzyme A thioesterase PaaI-like protein